MEIPLDRLPLDSVERHARLRDYFCDKDARASAGADSWTLDFHWSADPERYVDPRLADGLAWWGEGVRYETMFSAQRRHGKLLRCLYDSWTLASWSRWLADGHGKGAAPVILHVDDHRDFGSPRLEVTDSGWRDLISGRPFVLADPQSVEAAIVSGAVGMGSFMTPFLHQIPGCEIRHLCQPPKTTGTLIQILQMETVSDDLLACQGRRPTIERHIADGSTYGLRYLATCDPDKWLDEIEDRPMLLHVDMDYFNNRYDGDSDWAFNEARLDPSLDTILQKIDALTRALTGRDLVRRIDDIVIAYSPGFFPAEFWKEADARLVAGLGLT